MSGWLEGVRLEGSVVFRCAGCGAEHWRRCPSIPILVDGQAGLRVLHTDRLPEGWQRLNTTLYCPAHTIVVVEGRTEAGA